MPLIPSRSLRTVLSPLLLAAALCPLAAQTPTQSPGQTPSPPTAHPPNQANAPTPPMTKQQRKELLASVDSMLQFVSTDTALPIRHKVKRKLISREQVTRYLNQRMKDDESTKRLQRSEIVLKKFGLLDRSFDLQPFLVSLLTEQIAGFYDNKTKTVNLLDWVDPKEQKPVLAHELTHALQDQTVDLEKWGDSGVHGISKDFADDQRHVATDELETAREAIAEGQAMVVFYDDALRASGKSLADLPDNQSLIDPDGDSDTKGSPVMAHAPYLLQQSLLFPYSYGLGFENVILHRRGRQGAFADVLAAPPSTSYEVMNPRIWLEHGQVPTVAMPDLHPLLDPDYIPYDIGVMGELDVRILGHILGGEAAADKLAPNWAGGVYYAAQRRAIPDGKSSAMPAEQTSTASIALVYESRWRTREAARSFAALYALGLHHKYAAIKRRTADETSPSASEEQVYTTNEGDALILTSGHTVFVAEGLPVALARQVAQLFATPEGTGPQIQAKLNHPQLCHLQPRNDSASHELTLSVTHRLQGIAIPRPTVIPRPTAAPRPTVPPRPTVLPRPTVISTAAQRSGEIRSFKRPLHSPSTSLPPSL